METFVANDIIKEAGRSVRIKSNACASPSCTVMSWYFTLSSLEITWYNVYIRGSQYYTYYTYRRRCYTSAASCVSTLSGTKFLLLRSFVPIEFIHNRVDATNQLVCRYRTVGRPVCRFLINSISCPLLQYFAYTNHHIDSEYSST